MPDVVRLRESSTQQVTLSVEQADDLRRLGRELRGSQLFYLDEDDDTIQEEGTERETSVIACRHLHDDVYSVKVSNAVGAIGLTGLSLYVEPKIPVNHFAHVAKKTVARTRIGNDDVSIDSLDAFWELVATWCVTAVERVVRAGLLSDYRPETDDLALIRGRVDVRKTTQNFVQGRLRAHCTFEEYDIDHPLNRVLRAAMRFVASASWVSDVELKKRASRMDRVMEGVGYLQSRDLRIRTDRRTVRYVDALDLSLRVLGPLGANVLAGGRVGRTFLIPTPGMMEDGLRIVLAEALAPSDVRAGKKVVSNSPYFSINPDVLIDDGAVTGDVKYKVAGSSWVRNDVAQAALFATGFGARAAFLATFTDDEAVSDLHMNLGTLPLYRFVWHAVDGVSPEQAETDFVQRVRATLASFVRLRSVA